MHGGCEPDLTILFDVPTTVSRERLLRTAAQGRELDKFEREQGDFMARVRDVYLARAKAEPARIRIVDSSQPLDAVRARLREIVDQL